MHKLHVNKYKRKNLLSYHWGHTEEELKEARRNTKKMQRQRSMTQLMRPLHRAEEVFLSFKNIMRRKKGDELDDIDLSQLPSSYIHASDGSQTRHIRAVAGQNMDTSVASNQTA